MKLKMKLSIPKVDWQKILRPALSILVLGAFGYAGYLIRGSQKITPDQKYLKEQTAKSNLSNLKINEQLLNSLGQPKPLEPAGRDPFSP